MLFLRQLPHSDSFMASKYVNMQHIETLVVQHFKTKSARSITSMIDGAKGLSSSSRFSKLLWGAKQSICLRTWIEQNWFVSSIDYK